MMHRRITRRDALKAASAAALPLLAASATRANDHAKPASGLTLAIATTRFTEYTNRQLARLVAEQGIHLVQLFFTQSDSRYWKYNARLDVSDLTPDRCRSIADDYRSAGIEIHSIGVYTNLIHPDQSERKANLDYFEAMMKVAVSMGVKALITESGHYRPESPEARPISPIAYDFRENVWKQMVTTGKELAQRAEHHNVNVLFEASDQSFLASAKRTRMFLEEVGSPRIRALLDAANLLELNDLEEMFAQLRPWIDCLHAKDRKLHANHGVAAGQGDLDYQKYVTLAAKLSPSVPMIVEYVGTKELPPALAHLRDAMHKAGISERK